MPIFEYKCAGCGEAFEKLVVSHKSKVSCPECDSADVSRQLSTFAARVGGSGASPCKEMGCPMSGGCPGGGGCGLG